MKIDKTKLQKGLDKQDQILISNIIDKYYQYLNTKKNISSNHFLDGRQKKLIEERLSFLKEHFKFLSASEFCEKCILYFGKEEDWLTIYKIKNKNSIRHPDVLGTLFHIGYHPELIGDIFVEDDYIYLVNLTKMNSFLEDNLTMIKNVPVTLEKVETIELKKERFQNFTVLLTSMRLDHVVSKIMNTSRSIASDKIKLGEVIVNYQVVKKQDFILKIGDILSIRSVGKFIIFQEYYYYKKL